VAADADLRDAVVAGATAVVADVDDGAADRRAPVAVENDHVHEREVRRRPGRLKRGWRRGRRPAGVPVTAAAAREQHAKGDRYDNPTTHESRLETPSVGPD
jgi:hypothetical protein